MVESDRVAEHPENEIERRKPETPFQIAWRRFKTHKLARIGMAVLIIMAVLIVFAPFFAPYDYIKPNRGFEYVPPQLPRFVDEKGTFHILPFTYELEKKMDPRTWVSVYKPISSRRYPIGFFVKGWEYKLFGFIRWDRHFIGPVGGGQMFLLGTDELGRDLFSRILYGGRISLAVAIAGTVLGIVVGSLIGCLSSYYSGIMDTALQRIVELVQSIPKLPMWMALSVAIPSEAPPGLVAFGVIFIFALLNWPMVAREVRGKGLSIREEEYLLSAKAIGASDWRIITRHLLPNLFSHVIVVSTVSIPQLILAESALSFLGLGIQPPLASWGTLLRRASSVQNIDQYPWVLLAGTAILVTVLAFNMVGDGIRDALDPYSKV
jgi:peptide/nickel transport system permease protein